MKTDLVPQIHDFLIQLGKQGIKLGLENIIQLLKNLGNPHHHPRIIHIAGTNGKGSTLVALEQLLLCSGFSTGSTISPHLVKYNERFRINGAYVSDDLLIEAYNSVCIACGIDPVTHEDIKNVSRIHPTYFEFSIAIAFVLFRTNNVDYILLETGLGGRLDATNVVENPIACILTKIAEDHQDYLGNSLSEIATEKLGILKKGSPLFVSRQHIAVSNQIRRYCTEHENPIYAFGKEFNFLEDIEDEFVMLQNIKIKIPKIGLRGNHQKENIATALATYYSVVPDSETIDNKSIAHCIKSLKWNGRLQYLKNKGCNILLDGAHNSDSMEQLINYLRDNHQKDRILFAIGWMKGKEFASVLATISSLDVTFQPLSNFMDGSESGDRVEHFLQKQNKEVYQTSTVKELLKRVSTGKINKFDLVVIAGSLYLVGEFLSLWEVELKSLEEPIA